MGAIILDGYNRAYVLNLAKTLRRADVDHPLARSLQNDVKVAGTQRRSAHHRDDGQQRHDLDQRLCARADWASGRKTCASRGLIAGSAVARVDNKTAVAFGFVGRRQGDGAAADWRRAPVPS